VTSVLATWRRNKREATYFAKAKIRSETMSEGEIVANIDLALMTAGQAITRYRNSTDREHRHDQLREVRLTLEAALGMLENVLPD
jgi:hypothetical protein